LWFSYEDENSAILRGKIESIFDQNGIFERW
jgi:hypothetical protein